MCGHAECLILSKNRPLDFFIFHELNPAALLPLVLPDYSSEHWLLRCFKPLPMSGTMSHSTLTEVKKINT
jgi:hypothetical protein